MGRANRPDIESEISDTVDEVAISLASRRGDLEKEIVDVYTRKFTQAELESISYNTVTTHVKHIYRKLAVNSRAEAVFEAITLNLVDPD